MTIIEKIIRNNINADVKAGEIVTVNVDRVMIHDIFIPFVASKFEEMGFTKLWDADKAVLIYDHLVPASQVDDTRHFRVGDAFVEKYGMKHVHRSDGICQVNLSPADDRGRLCQAGRYRVWHRQPHDDIRLCRRIFIGYRVYGDGKHTRHRHTLDPRAGDDQGEHHRKAAGECHGEGHHIETDR